MLYVCVNMFRFKTSLFLYALLLCSVSVSLCVAQGFRDQNYDLYADTDYEDPGTVHAAAPSNHPVYRPVPQQPPPPPKDPNVIFVPRMGNVRGNVGYKTIRNRAINAFLGLQYGTVLPGLGRFQKAVLHQNNNRGIIDATTEPKACPQYPNLHEAIENESLGVHFGDCLYLNIYAPDNRTELLPVMVYVHGEMLFDGSAEEAQPDYLLEQDVVLVSISYRLAPFGFLTTLTDELPGNVALADIQMALEWVQLYIRPFGGNPDRVTLFGQAGGATLVHALSLSGKAQGLFHKLILQSGSALNPYFLDEDPLSTVRSLARLARCPVGGIGMQSLISCFESMSTANLLEAFKRHWQENEPRGLRFTGGFKLVVGDRLGYLTQPPAALLAENKYPMIAGVTKDAGAFIMSRFYNQLSSLRTRNISDYINIVLKHTSQPRHYGIWKHWALQHIFTEQEERNPTLPALAQGLLELTNLILYRAPLIDSIRYTSPYYPTYLYCFDYRGEFHRFGHLANPLPFEADATLSDENIYLFPYPVEVAQLSGEDKIIAHAISSSWTSFAASDSTFNTGGKWPPVRGEYGPFVRFSNGREAELELDFHFGEGIPVPNLYPEYFTTTTTTTSTSTTTSTERPEHNFESNYGNHLNAQNYANYANNPHYPNHQNYPNYPNYPNQQNYPSYPSYPSYQQQRTPPPYEHVLGAPQQQTQHRTPNYANNPYRNVDEANERYRHNQLRH